MRWLGSVLLVLAPAAAAQTTWYVDVNGTAPGAGSQADPYASIQYAHDQATTQDYDTVLVAPGTYDEHLHITKSVTIRSTAGPLATVIHPSTPGNTVGLDAPPADFLGASVEGFTIFKVGASESTAAARGMNGKVRHCILIGNGKGFGALSEYDFGVEYCTSVGHRIGIVEAPYFGLAYVDSSIAFGNLEHDVQQINGNYLTRSCYGHGLVYSSSESVEGDPQFFDLAAGNLHLQASSPCVDTGTPTLPGDPFGPFDEMGALAFDASFAPLPSTYCTAKSNSFACVPSIGSIGAPSASGSAFVITCVNELNQRPGLLFYGYEPNGTVFQGGWLCVKAPTRRTPLADSGGSSTGLDCTGAYAFDFGARIQSGIDPGLVAGEMVYCQFWSRDGGDPTGFGTNRSNALRFGIAP